MGWTGELWLNCIFLTLRNKEFFFWIFFLHKFQIFGKKNYSLTTFDIFDFFLDFFDIYFCLFFLFLHFWDFKTFFGHFWISFEFFGFFSKLLRLLINITKVTTDHQKWLKIGTNRIKASFFCPKGKKSLGQSPPQELEVSPHMRRQSVTGFFVILP